MIAITPLMAYFLPKYWQMGSYVYHGIIYILPNTHYIILHIVGLVVDIWDCYYTWGSYLLSLYISSAVQLTYKASIEKCIEKFHKGVTSRHPLRNLEENLLVIKKLKIIIAVYNNVYGILYVPSMSSLLCAMTVLNVFITIRLSSRGGPLVTGFGVCCIIAALIATPLFIESNALVHQSSVKYKLHLSRQNACKTALGRRLYKSISTDSVKCGRFYDVRKITCLTFLGLIANVCGSALISVQV